MSQPVFSLAANAARIKPKTLLAVERPAAPRNYLAVGLAVVAAGAVLAFGGVEPRSILIIQIAVGVIAAVAFGTDELRIPQAALAIFLVLGIWPLLQVIPLPGILWQWIAPTRAELYQQTLGPWGLAKSTFALSAMSHATLQAWARIVCYLLVAALAASWELRRRANVLPWLLTILGVFEALYGLIQYLTHTQYIFFYRKEFYANDATGTYINHNHYAGFLEMVLPFLLAVVMFRDADRSPLRKRWALLFSDSSLRWFAQIVLLGLVCLALLLSRSRMGMVSFGVTVLLIASLTVFRGGRGAWFTIVMVIVIPAIFAMWMGIDPVIQRFGGTDLHGVDNRRMDMWRDAVGMIRHNPVFGTGLGTYFSASPRYQTLHFENRIDHPHNDYLEFAAEAGVPVALLLFGSLWWLVIQLARSVSEINRRSDLLLATGCCGALCSVLIHSSADFNLQIPANALLFSWIAGTSIGLVSRLQEYR